jgi:hypothetical protein
MMQPFNIRREPAAVKLANLNLVGTQTRRFSFLHRHHNAAVIDTQSRPRSVNLWTCGLTVHVLMQKAPIEQLVVPTGPHVLDYRR